MHVGRDPERPEEPHELHYASRAPQRAAFLDEITQSFAHRTTFHFSGEAGSRIDVSAVLAGASREDHIYCCGPAGLVDSVVATALAGGWPSDHIHVERFTAEAPTFEGSTAFDVTARRTGMTLTVAADQTLLQALLDAGIDLPYSCESGFCGTCVTPLIDGEADHRDVFLTAEEKCANDRITVCCSRAKSGHLVLDV